MNDAKLYVVIDDGQFIYPVLLGDLRQEDTEELLKGMSSDEYAEFCNKVPADQRRHLVGTQNMIEFCRALVRAGATLWRIK